MTTIIAALKLRKKSITAAMASMNIPLDDIWGPAFVGIDEVDSPVIIRIFFQRFPEIAGLLNVLIRLDLSSVHTVNRVQIRVCPEVNVDIERIGRGRAIRVRPLP